MLRRFSTPCFPFLALLFTVPAFAGPMTGDWLELIDTSKLPLLRDDVTLQVSSYDRTGGNDDGFSGTYSFLRIQEDGGYVIFEDEGPGCIYRFWSANPGDQRMEFYFDGEKTPRLVFDHFSDMFTNKTAPFVWPFSVDEIGGKTSYVPLPYARSLKIVTRERINFYQVTYTKFSSGEGVESFTPEVTPEEQARMDRVKERWTDLGNAPWTWDQAETRSQTFEASTDDKTMELTGPATVAGFTLTFDQLPEKALRNLVFVVQADGGDVEVEVPLGDFFLQGFPHEDTQSLLCGRMPGAPHTLYSYWPMPFAESMTITVRDEHPAPLGLTMNVTAAPGVAEGAGRFHAKWLRQNPTEAGQLFPILDAKGRGHWCGVSVAMQGYQPGLGFLEGDEMLWWDGRDNTSYNGTGSEDYYNGGWYFGRTGSYPYYGCGTHAPDVGRCHAFRLHMTDLVPFQHYARIGIEHGHGNEYEADYAGTTFWYAAATDSEAIIPPLPNQQARQWTPVALENFIEAENVLVRGENAHAVTDADLEGFCSGGKGVRMEPGGRALLGVPVQAAGVYQPVFRRPEDGGAFTARIRFEGTPTQVVRWTPADEEQPEQVRVPWLRLARGDSPVEIEAINGAVVLDGLWLHTPPSESGVLEGEALPAVAPVEDGRFYIADIEPADMSGYSALRIVQDKPGDGASFGWYPKIGGNYIVALRLREGPYRPTAQLTLDGEPVGEPIVPAAAAEEWPEVLFPVSLPPVEAGEHRLSLVMAAGGLPGESLLDYLTIRPEGQYEAESLEVVEAANGPVDVQDMQPWPETWSGAAQLWFRPLDANAHLTLSIDVPRDGEYRLCAWFTKAPDYGAYQVQLDGENMGDPFDGYAGGVVRSEEQCFGTKTLSAGGHLLTFVCTGKNAESTSFMLGVDLVTVTAVVAAAE